MGLLERNLVPDRLIRFAIGRLLRARLAAGDKGSPEARQAHRPRLVAALKASPVAINTADANARHCELPSELFTLVPGSDLKYSCCYYRLDGAAQATRSWVCWRVFFNGMRRAVGVAARPRVARVA
jgi:hypothetical protein